MQRIFQLMMAVVGLGLCPQAHALNPPIGWTQIAPDRAVLDPDDPNKGVLYEFRIDDGKGTPDELVAALAEQDIVIDRFGVEKNGYIKI